MFLLFAKREKKKNISIFSFAASRSSPIAPLAQLAAPSLSFSAHPPPRKLRERPDDDDKPDIDEGNGGTDDDDEEDESAIDRNNDDDDHGPRPRPRRPPPLNPRGLSSGNIKTKI